jgi:hypothetical protein
MALIAETDALAPTSPTPGAVPLVAATDAKVLNANTERNGVSVTADTANTAVTYVRLGTAAATAADWHYALAAGASWDGLVGGVTWRGEIHCICSAIGKVGVAEV